jgi:predicted transposase/invertase (TIGR01784 family)
MKRDTLFYKIFQQAPNRFFELMAAVYARAESFGNTASPVPLPINTDRYTFGSVEVKEAAFRIDGVFQPPNARSPVYFAEVQMQRDNDLNERIFSEVGIFIRQNKGNFRDWQVAIIYPTRKIEQISTEVPAELFASGRFLRVYLDELGPIDELPIGLGLMVLTTTKEKLAVASAKQLIAKSRGLPTENAIIGMIAEIIVYKFSQLSREEVDTMLDIKLQDTRVYQEAKAEGRAEGQKEGQKEALCLLLEQKFGSLSPQQRSTIGNLNSEQLTELTRSLLSFQNLQSLESWLQTTTSNS